MSVLTMNCSTSLSMPTLGRSGIMWATTLKPASFARWKDSHTARTVWPLEDMRAVWKSEGGRREKKKTTIKAAFCFSSLNRFNHSFVPPWPVCVTGHVLVHTLDAYLQPRAAVTQHITEVSLQAVVWPRLDSDSHALGVTALRVPAGEKPIPGTSGFTLYHITSCRHYMFFFIIRLFSRSSETQSAGGLRTLGSFNNINIGAESCAPHYPDSRRCRHIKDTLERWRKQLPAKCLSCKISLNESLLTVYFVPKGS